MSDAVIFDMDGVLVDSGPAHADSWRVLAQRHGVTMTDEQFKSSFGQTSRDIIQSLWGPAVSAENTSRFDEEKEAIYRELIAGKVPLMNGAREMLTTLREAGYLLAIATSGPRENVELVLRQTRLGPLFETTVSGFDVNNGKPAPDCFLLAARRIGAQPQRCVVVEDAPVGIRAALAAGMKPIGLVGTHPRQRLSEAGAAVVERLADITPRLVSELLATP